MPHGEGPLRRAKRAFVRVILFLAQKYQLDVNINRDSQDGDVMQAYRRVVRRVHPDKGGRTKDAQQLQAVKEAWVSASQEAAGRHAGHSAAPKAAPKARGASGTKRDDVQHGATARRLHGAREPSGRSNHASSLALRDQPGFRFNTTAALLTYNGIQDLEQWHRFLKYIAKHKKEWQVLHWCASMEEGKSGTKHIHFMVQFTAKVDRTSRSFSFEGIAPNCSPSGPSTDLCGEMLRGRYPQRSIDRD